MPKPSDDSPASLSEATTLVKDVAPVDRDAAKTVAHGVAIEKAATAVAPHPGARVGASGAKVANAESGERRLPRLPQASTKKKIERIEGADAELVDDRSFAERYELHAVLGEGGMGEVYLGRDARIGRDVAVKVMRAEHGERSDLRRRFLREARVQGQLEHPSIVPVYDLGLDSAGNAYFTMKRVRGQTLEQVIAALRAGNEEAKQKHTRFKLMSAFTDACLAVHFAHTRGALHRDIKPGNIMLGNFGEVYVLDWGLAKVVGAKPLDVETPLASPVHLSPRGERKASARPPAAPVDNVTSGALMGTPGYMAPEQIRPEPEGVGAAADIYALGAILYEILALEPLHGRGSLEKLMASTLMGVDAASLVARSTEDIAPELGAIVARATAVDPQERYPSARALHDAVEGFISGDRDLTRRRELAREHAALAQRHAARALDGQHPVAERSAAMREVSRAVALDPENAEAMATLVRLLTDLPRALPAEVQRELEAQARDWQRRSGRLGMFAYLSFALYAPLGYWMGVRDKAVAIALPGLWVITAAMAYYSTRHPHPAGRTRYSVMVMSNFSIAFASLIFGPFVLVPALAAVNALAFVTSSDRSRRLPAVALGCAALVVPLLLERVGAVPPSFSFTGGEFTLLPRALYFREGPTVALLLLSNLALLITAAWYIGRFKDVLTAAENRLYMQTWLLRQFVPGEAQASLAPKPLSSSSVMDAAKGGAWGGTPHA